MEYAVSPGLSVIRPVPSSRAGVDKVTLSSFRAAEASATLLASTTKRRYLSTWGDNRVVDDLSRLVDRAISAVPVAQIQSNRYSMHRPTSLGFEPVDACRAARLLRQEVGLLIPSNRGDRPQASSVDQDGQVQSGEGVCMPVPSSFPWPLSRAAPLT